MLDISKILKEYKFKKSCVETTMARIEQYTYAINNPDLWESELLPEGREIGMPGAPLRNTSSPIERFIARKELTIDMLKDWIRDDESRIFMYKLEVEQIEKALEALTPQEKYIIELKYFSNMTWKEIEYNVNDKFKNYISQERIRKINKESVDKLKVILEPFYMQFRVA